MMNDDVALGFIDDPDTLAKRKNHPYAVIFHVLFRSAALVIYVLSEFVFGMSFITSFVIVVLLLSADFWTVKNVTGRLLVGLRWWNYVDDDGVSHWQFETRKGENDPYVNPSESSVFWSSLIAFPVMWAVLLVIALFRINFKWMMIVVIAIMLTGANLYGYLKCKMGGNDASVTQKVSSMAKNLLQQQLLQNMTRKGEKMFWLHRGGFIVEFLKRSTGGLDDIVMMMCWKLEWFYFKLRFPLFLDPFDIILTSLTLMIGIFCAVGMAQFGEWLDIGRFPSTAGSAGLLGIAPGEDRTSTIIITPTPNCALIFDLHSKTTKKTWEIPGKFGRLSSQVVWSRKSQRYAALCNKGDSLLIWPEDADSLEKKGKNIPLSRRAWRLVRCLKCSDAESWVVYQNGGTVRVNEVVSRGSGGGDVGGASNPGSDSALLDSGETIEDAAIFCNGNRHELAVLAVAKKSGGTLSYAVRTIVRGLESGEPMVKRFCRLFEDRVVAAETVGGHVGDEEGSDEGFIDSTDTRMTDDSNGSERIAVDALGGGDATPGALLASAFCTEGFVPFLYTVWQDNQLRRLALPTEETDAWVGEGKVASMEVLFKFPKANFGVEPKFRPSICAVDRERIVVHSVDSNRENGCFGLWNVRWGGMCESIVTTKMFHPLPETCRTTGSWRVGAYFVSVDAFSAIKIFQVKLLRPSTLASTMGLALAPVANSKFWKSSSFSIPFSGELKPVTEYDWTEDEQPKMSMNHYELAESVGEKTVAAYLREGRVSELVDCFSSDQLFVRDSLLISAVNFAIGQKTSFVNSSKNRGANDVSLPKDRIDTLRLQLLAHLVRQPVTGKILTRKLNAFPDEKKFKLLSDLLTLVERQGTLWDVATPGSTLALIFDWIKAGLDVAFPSSAMRGQKAAHDYEELWEMFNRIKQRYSEPLAEIRLWDGPIAEVRRRAAEAKLTNIAAANLSIDPSEVAKKSGIDAIRDSLAHRPGEQSKKLYRVRVIANFW
ncbi:unnamed protein product [Notodromas monacha]|uniref:Nucleolar protein 11 N-terminal domain-containing protein n=1 Tax=Notodromas monacha TaxID=399045 RepID=A0A7R9BE01_9CRUS|nr:unnamed protein product [Notodromas monacha]CAG0913647.1 unnamed protein product [Notodromas monacha]